MFSEACDKGMLPNEFVNHMRKQHKLIMGIGHRVKSVSSATTADGGGGVRTKVNFNSLKRF